jgi:uncharacterized protein YbjT (DUF2867 family)
MFVKGNEIMTNSMEGRPILVLGGSGKTGRRVVERLKARGIAVRATSRSGDTPFDWTDRSSWAPALADVAAVYIAYYPDLVVPGAAEAVGEFARLAVDNGVRRLVLLSGRGEEEAEDAEQKLIASDADWTILRCSWFAQNFSESFLADGLIAGEVVLPAGRVTEPFVDAEDIADAAVAALTEDGHVGELYELTGPRLLTFREATAEVAKATGREIGYVEVSTEEYLAAVAQEGLPDEIVGLVAELFTKVLDGRNSHLTDGVERALGRPPRDFADYAQATAATGIWEGRP